VFPDQAGITAHPRVHPGRAPLYSFPDGRFDPDFRLELRDHRRWYRLWERRQLLVGIAPTPRVRAYRCRCGVPDMSCGVDGCDLGPGPWP